jgi:hypothetical protein
MTKISTTLIAEVVKLISVFALILGFEVDESNLEVIVGILLLIGSSIWTLRERYKRGDLDRLFKRKNS